MYYCMLTLLIIAAEVITDAAGLPWQAVTAVATVVVAVVTILWRTSEARTAKLLDLQERTLTALANNSAALESLKDALEKQ